MINLKFKSLFKRLDVTYQPKLITITGLFFALIYAYAKPAYPNIAGSAASFSMLLAFFALYKYGKQVRSHIMWRFVWIICIIQTITWTLSYYQIPELAEPHLELDYMARWFVFIPLSWWVAQHRANVWIFWGIAALAIFTAPWTMGGGWHEIMTGINGRRVDFELRNAQHTTMFFSVILIGISCFASLILKHSKVAAIPLILLIVTCLIGILISASRQSWLGLLILGLLASGYFYYIKTRHLKLQTKALILSLVVTSIIALTAGMLSIDRVAKQVQREHNTLVEFVQLDIEKMPYSSFGIRVHLWANALNFIKQKPIFGWGSNGQKLTVHQAQKPYLDNTRISTIDHMHSHYIETLVNFGIVGLLFYFSIWIVIGRMLFREIKKQTIEKEFGYFFVSIFIFWSVICFFESYLNMWTGIHFFTVFMAGILGKIWHTKLHSHKT